MIKFKHFLAERKFDLEGEQISFNIVFKIQHSMIPYSNKLKKLFKPYHDKTKTFFHITGVDGVEELFKLQNSAKSISTMKTDAKKYPDMIYSGVSSQKGFLVELTGDQIIGADFDIFSYPDKQGRRWGELKKLFFSGYRDDHSPEDTNILKKVLEQFKDEQNKWYEKNSKELWKKYSEHSDYSKQPTMGNSNSENWALLVDSLVSRFNMKIPMKIQGEIKKNITTSYITFVYKHIEKNMDLWRKALSIVNFKDDDKMGDYDETLLNNFKITKIHINEKFYNENKEKIEPTLNELKSKHKNIPFVFIR